MWSLEQLLARSPADFEMLIAELWTAMGYEVVRGPVGGSDGGVDVLARSNSVPRLTISIQAKLYQPDSKVGVREVREYASLRQRTDIDAVVVVTSSSFTSSAESEAEILKVKLVDGGELVDLLEQYSIPDPSNLNGAVSVPGHPAGMPAHSRPSGQLTGAALPSIEEPKLGHTGWGVFLVLVGVGGIGSVATGDNPWWSLFLTIPAGLVGVMFILASINRYRNSREFELLLGIPRNESRRLAAIGIRGILGIAQMGAAELSGVLALPLSDSLLLVRKANILVESRGVSDKRRF